jgi:hypothetical protein
MSNLLYCQRNKETVYHLNEGARFLYNGETYRLHSFEMEGVKCTLVGDDTLHYFSYDIIVKEI